MSILRCPKCSNTLRPIEDGGVDFERCSGCNGQWYDHMVLEAAFKKWLPARHVGNVDDFMNPHASRSTELPCPRCPEKLLEVAQAGVTVEWCQGCRGLYLDEGELGRIRQWRRSNFVADMGKVARRAAEVAAEMPFESRIPLERAPFDLLLWLRHRGEPVDDEEKNAYQHWLETGEH